MSRTVVSLLALAIVTVYGRTVNEESKHWAVIVAGSNGWYNYRHQADACHAYQIVLKNGIPAERIITMMYDDIAQNKENPTPGKIINRPDGPDVYQGVQIDYRGLDVNPKNFLKVLSGDKAGLRGVGNGRVLESGPNDHVFINFVDHGAPGIIAFGREFLHASDLHNTIMGMNQNQMYKQMVIYIEACESGSMFTNDLLPKNINVFATTAANAHESSYACYMDKERKTFLGDVYSVKWMEDSDKEDLSMETLEKQFEIVKRETNTSHVQEYGDLTMGSLDVGEFQGKDKQGIFDKVSLDKYPITDAVPSEDVELNILELSMKMAKNDVERKEYLNKINLVKLMREKTQKIFKHIVAVSVDSVGLTTQMLRTRSELVSTECYKDVVEKLKDSCPILNLAQNDFALRQLYTLVNLCELPVPRENIIAAIESVVVDTQLCN